VAFDQDDLDSLILRIHAAPLQPERWADVVEELRRLADAQRALIHAPTPHDPSGYWCVTAQWAPEAILEYARDWAHQDPWAEGAHRRGLTSAGLVYPDDAVVHRREFLQSAFFNDFLKPWETDSGSCFEQEANRFRSLAYASQLISGAGRGRFLGARCCDGAESGSAPDARRPKPLGGPRADAT
jgi:hypothetical protein